jgi:hypothetical protein
MKKILFLLLFLYAISGWAQAIYPWDDHIFPFCTDENPYGITYRSGITGEAGFPQRGAMGCLGNSPGPVWYYMQIDQPGDLLIYIEQYSIIAHRLLDVDFACWGPFQATSKREFLHKLKNSYELNVDRCSSHRPSNGDHSNDMGGFPHNNLVDCSFYPDGTEWCYIPNAKSGEWYLLLITNYSRQPGKIHFERVDEHSTATTRCDVTLPLIINPVPKDLKQIDDHTSAICLYEEKALVTIELEPDEGFTLSDRSLRNTKVDVYSNGKTYSASLKDGHFECEIDLENDTTAYYAIVECPDPNFRFQTENHYLVKTTDCDPDKYPPAQRDTIRTGSVNFSDLKRGETPITVDFSDYDDYKEMNLSDYDVVVDSDNPFVEGVLVEKDGNSLRLTPKLRGDWCECFMSDSITFRVRLLPQKGNNSRTFEIPVTVGVNHQSIWLFRCFWVLVTLFGLLLAFFYMRALLLKPRFKKSATINAISYNRYGAEIDNGYQLLRQPGFPAWFARWFWPGAERSTLSFNEPAVSAITFVASVSKEAVDVTKLSIDSNTMSIANYDPANDPAPKSPVRLVANDQIKILKSNGLRTGYLFFSPGEEEDGHGYRIFIRLLLLANIAAIGVLLFILIKSLL